MSDDQSYIPVLNVTSDVEAQIYKSLLEEAGIPVLDRPVIDPLISNIYVQRQHHQLQVREADAEEARRIIEAHRAEVEAGAFEVSECDIVPSDEEQPAETGPAAFSCMRSIGLVFFVSLVLLAMCVIPRLGIVVAAVVDKVMGK